MPGRTLPGVGLQAFAPKNEGDWHLWTDPNWRIVSALLMGRVKSIVATLPTSPTNGDMHIVTTGGNAQQIALRDNGVWVYLTPQIGWRMFDAENLVTFEFNGTDWSAATGTLADLSATGNAPAMEMKKRGSSAGANAPNAAYSSMGFFRWLGWTGSAWRTAAQMLVQTQDLWSATANGSAIVFQVIAAGTTALVDRLQLTANALLPAQTDGLVDLGGNTTRWRRLFARNIEITPTATETPSVNGAVTFQLDSNTALRIRVRGTDGVIRGAVLTLM